MSHPIMASTYGPNDGYFIEDDSVHGYGSHVDLRERAKIIARERQLSIAEELNQGVVDTYLTDIRQHLEEMEVGCPG